MAPLTPSQTIGPFFHNAGEWLVNANAVPESWDAIVGSVLDLDGQGVSDALLEISVAAGDTVIQRVYTDERGAFKFHLPARGVGHVSVFARGLLRHLFTRVYLDESALPAQIAPERRATLWARPESGHFRWDIRLRGANETVFFDLREP